MEVTRVDYVRVPVDDIEAATHFYGEILGLPRNDTSITRTGSSTRRRTSHSP